MKNSLLIFFFFASFGISQNFNFSENPYNPLNKPNTYKNIDNPNYWKTKNLTKIIGNKMFIMK